MSKEKGVSEGERVNRVMRRRQGWRWGEQMVGREKNKRGEKERERKRERENRERREKRKEIEDLILLITCVLDMYLSFTAWAMDTWKNSRLDKTVRKKY